MRVLAALLIGSFGGFVAGLLVGTLATRESATGVGMGNVRWVSLEQPGSAYHPRWNEIDEALR